MSLQAEDLPARRYLRYVSTLLFFPFFMFMCAYVEEHVITYKHSLALQTFSSIIVRDNVVHEYLKSVSSCGQCALGNEMSNIYLDMYSPNICVCQQYCLSM